MLVKKGGVKIKRIITVLVMNFMMLGLMFSEVSYSDIREDHWAYKAIENLEKNNVFNEKANTFRGDETLTRYEFVVMLSNLINRIDLIKANKEDLRILESIIFDFSSQLNKMGFNSGDYTAKIKKLTNDVNRLNEKLKKSEAMIEELMKRIEKLEEKK